MRSLMIALAAAAFAAPAWGQKIDNLGALNQEEFRQLSEDLAGALAYRPMAPAEPLGIFGFDVGVGLTGAKLKHAEVLEKATVQDAPETLPIATLRARVGLPLNLDLGLAYAQVPSSNITYYGTELKWAFIPGSSVAPAFAARGHYTRVSGMQQMRLETYGGDVSVSKGIAFLTPYAGIGYFSVKSDPKNNFGLKQETFTMGRVFIGTSMSFLLLNFNLEADKTGDVSAVSAKLGLKF